MLHLSQTVGYNKTKGTALRCGKDEVVSGATEEDDTKKEQPTRNL